jgi:RNA polymerase sigma-70 factor (ECF subfamily)
VTGIVADNHIVLCLIFKVYFQLCDFYLYSAINCLKEFLKPTCQPLSRDNEPFLSSIESNKGIIYKVANSYCKDAADREDLIQEIILQLWKAYPNFKPDYKLSTWMYRIALNVAISAYRKASKRSQIHQPLSETAIFLAEDKNEANDTRDQLQTLIRELKEVDRALILLYLEGYLYPEIGQILGISESNVATKLSRIKQQLKKKFIAQ